ncbi:uncharacterized protein EI97DRAFT_455971 [Westerdykella ornata]|uniref:Biotrophy-associated secreted protein 2 n=1 Tax=Westerdykella ornata TaxID=318751 RepID=A0A6A6JT75_WESOR|nr:uncharacterized protein EI97DRAFT_455971 [Westerdykella ornata]KAF2279772.1 hypothetical protein EI97DRAFT_455971 [Westerdykella ornata]
MRFSIATIFSFLALALAQLKPNNAGARNVGSGDGSQFITGGCVSDADCQSGCCADLSGVGICSAEAAAFQAGKNGCGFVDPDAQATIAAAQAQVERQGFKRVVRRTTA